MKRLICLIAVFILFGSIGVALTDEPKVPEGVLPLTEAEIRKLFEGKTFEFVAYDEPLTGTTTWDRTKGTVSGTYVFDQEETGEFELKWFLKDGMSCIETGEEPQCQFIYLYEEGFMEVRPDGVVHAVSKPIN